MIPETVLTTRRAPVVLKPKVGMTRLNEVRGGPDVLLHWLETQLGLTGRAVPRANRVTELAGWLDGAENAVFGKSLATDRWATASQLLHRLDEIRTAGWTGAADASLPTLICDLSRVSEA